MNWIKTGITLALLTVAGQGRADFWDQGTVIAWLEGNGYQVHEMVRGKLEITNFKETSEGWFFLAHRDGHRKEGAYFARISQTPRGQSVEQLGLPGIEQALHNYFRFKTLTLRPRVGGTDTGILKELFLGLEEGFTYEGKTYLIAVPLYRIDYATGQFEIISRPRLEDGQRQTMFLQMADVHHPSRRKGLCTRLLDFASRMWDGRRFHSLGLPQTK